MSAHFLSVPPQQAIYGFSSAELRRSARRQLGVSSFILACFGIGCALAFAI
ncbi:MAG TPA: hypothetical protein PKA55_10845 [Rhodoblastus sp.]|nr:hypothetical protein [Rhodoblastus sp.]